MAGANLDRARSFAPYLRNKKGMGAVQKPFVSREIDRRTRSMTPTKKHGNAGEDQRGETGVQGRIHLTREQRETSPAETPQDWREARH